MTPWQQRWQQRPEDELDYTPVEPPPDRLHPSALYVHAGRYPHDRPYHGGDCPFCREENPYDPA